METLLRVQKNRYSLPGSAGLSQGLIRSVAWVCVVLQLLFPVMAAASGLVRATAQPAATAAGGERIMSVSLQPERTTVYRLGPLESAQSVAERYGMTLEELRHLNQLRTFAHGFDNVRQGDELEVPISVRSPGQTPPERPHSDDEMARRVAVLGSQGADLLTRGGTGREAASMASGMARGYATGQAASAVSDWMSQFGTARIALNTDEKLSLKGSQADLLLAWYDTPAHLLFS